MHLFSARRLCNATAAGIIVYDVAKKLCGKLFHRRARDDRLTNHVESSDRSDRSDRYDVTRARVLMFIVLMLGNEPCTYSETIVMNLPQYLEHISRVAGHGQSTDT